MILLAQANEISGLSITTLVSQLGASAAVVLVVIYGIKALDKLWDRVERYLAERDIKFQSQLDKIDASRNASQREFQDQIRGITESQNQVLARVTQNMVDLSTSVTKSMIELSGSVNSLEKSLSSLERKFDIPPRSYRSPGDDAKA